MPFNPDAYLAKGTKEFNPDAYLGESPSPGLIDKAKGAIESATGGYLNFKNNPEARTAKGLPAEPMPPVEVSVGDNPAIATSSAVGSAAVGMAGAAMKPLGLLAEKIGLPAAIQALSKVNLAPSSYVGKAITEPINMASDAAKVAQSGLLKKAATTTIDKGTIGGLGLLHGLKIKKKLEK